MPPLHSLPRPSSCLGELPAPLVCFRGSMGAPDPCKPSTLWVLLACGNSFVWFQIWLITECPPPEKG